MRKNPDLTDFELELFTDIAEGRRNNYFLLTPGEKKAANYLQERDLILTGQRDRRQPLALTEDGKRLAQAR